jgi:hypothetical protein
MTAPVNVAAPPAANAGQVVTTPPPRLVRLDRPGRLAGVGLTQVVAGQTGLTALAVGIGVWSRGHGPGRWAWLTVGVVVALLAAATLIRRDGRWLSEWALIRTRWWLRRRRGGHSPTGAVAAVPAPSVSARTVSGPAPGTGPIMLGGSTGVPADLAAVLPGVKASAFVDRAARRHGLLFDGAEWTAVLAVSAPDQVVELGSAAARVPLRVLAAGLEDRGIRLRTVQLLSVTAPLRVDLDLASEAAAIARRRSPGTNPPGSLVSCMKPSRSRNC